MAELLKAEPNVVGFDSLNEPSVGFASRDDLRSTEGLKNGTFVSGWEAIKLGAGFAVESTRYSPIFVPRGKVLLNPSGKRAWADGASCVWEMHGVYKLPAAGSSGEPELLKPDYFSRKPELLGRNHVGSHVSSCVGSHASSHVATTLVATLVATLAAALAAT